MKLQVIFHHCKTTKSTYFETVFSGIYSCFDVTKHLLMGLWDILTSLSCFFGNVKDLAEDNKYEMPKEALLPFPSIFVF